MTTGLAEQFNVRMDEIRKAVAYADEVNPGDNSTLGTGMKTGFVSEVVERRMRALPDHGMSEETTTILAWAIAADLVANDLIRDEVTRTP